MSNLLKDNLTKWIVVLVMEPWHGGLVPCVTPILHLTSFFKKNYHRRNGKCHLIPRKSQSYEKNDTSWEKKKVSNNTIKILCQHLTCNFAFYYIIYSVIHMNVFTHCCKGLVYGSSPLIKLRKNTLFKNGFRPNFCFDLNCLSNQLEFMHIEILIFFFWNMKRKQIGNMLQKCNTTKYLIQSTWVQEMQTQIPNLIFNSCLSFWFPLREGCFPSKCAKLRLCESSHCPLAYLVIRLEHIGMN